MAVAPAERKGDLSCVGWCVETFSWLAVPDFRARVIGVGKMDCEVGRANGSADYNRTTCLFIMESVLVAADMMDDYALGPNGTTDSHEDGRLVTVSIVTAVFVRELDSLIKSVYSIVL